jgi:hypothetical protein
MKLKSAFNKLVFAWERLTVNPRIRFTWGGGPGQSYTVNIRFESLFSVVYETVFRGIRSCYEAQQIAQGANLALKRWAPRLLHKDADLPGMGFQYLPSRDQQK